MKTDKVIKDEKYTVRVTSELREAIERIAKHKDVPNSQVIREAIKKYLKEIE